MSTRERFKRAQVPFPRTRAMSGKGAKPRFLDRGKDMDIHYLETDEFV